MSVGERVIREIDQLTEQEKRNVVEKMREKYFPYRRDVFLVCDHYDFWLNDKDDEYDQIR